MTDSNREKRNILKRIQRFFLDIFFPIECLGCGCEGEWLCRSCFQSLEINDSNRCLICKKENTFGRFCEECNGYHYLDGIWIASDYNNEIIQKAVKAMKYKLAFDIARSLGIFLCLHLKNLNNQHRILKGKDLRLFREKENTVVVPVPLHRKRLRWRGFNQSQLMAEVICENFKLAMNTGLRRIKNKKPQAQLNKDERLLNVADSFFWEGGNLENKKIILIDDVVTTGATLMECAKILKKAGAKEVWGLVVASKL